MRYMGKKSLSRVLQIALAAAWYGAIAAIAVAVFLVVRAAFWGGSLPPPSGIQVNGAGLSLLFRGPELQGINRTWILVMLGTVFLPATLTLLYVVGQLRQVIAWSPSIPSSLRTPAIYAGLASPCWCWPWCGGSAASSRGFLSRCSCTRFRPRRHRASK